MKRSAFDNLAEKVRNWNRWGAEDGRGTLNHIGPEALRRAAAHVTAGKLFNLGLRFDQDGPQGSHPLRFNPKLYVTALATPFSLENPSACYSDDVIHMPLQCATQWDALCHVHYDGLLYNGHKASESLGVMGAARLGVEHLAAPGILSRGVLLDIARLNGVERLPLDHAISVDELLAACKGQHVEVLPGDIVVVRTGHLRHFTVDRNRALINSPQPGLAADCAEWLHAKSVAAVAADNVAVEFLDEEVLRGDMPLPLHMLCLRDMGMPLGEMFDLEALAADCALDGRYAFMLAAPPLAVTGAFGSPVNPVALK
jgi:kynurenine formamidase